MSPRATIDRPSAHPSSPSRRGPSPRLLLAVVAVLAVVGLVRLVPTERFVPRITYVNRSPYDFHVEVASSRTDGWMDAGEAFRATRSDAEEIYDLGGTWWFRFSAQGRTSRPFPLSRDRLERSNWTVAVPDAAVRDLESRGVPVQP